VEDEGSHIDENSLRHKVVEILEYEVTNEGGIRTSRTIGQVSPERVCH